MFYFLTFVPVTQECLLSDNSLSLYISDLFISLCIILHLKRFWKLIVIEQGAIIHSCCLSQLIILPSKEVLVTSTQDAMDWVSPWNPPTNVRVAFLSPSYTYRKNVAMTKQKIYTVYVFEQFHGQLNSKKILLVQLTLEQHRLELRGSTPGFVDSTNCGLQAVFQCGWESLDAEGWLCVVLHYLCRFIWGTWASGFWYPREVLEPIRMDTEGWL